jgi:hypothetical protein
MKFINLARRRIKDKLGMKQVEQKFSKVSSYDNYILRVFKKEIK